jgi:conjugative transfer region protein TrbK
MRSVFKFLGVAVLAGLMLVGGMAMARVSRPTHVAPGVRSSAAPTSPHVAALRQCQTITQADGRCAAVWDAERRRFFDRRGQ